MCHDERIHPLTCRLHPTSSTIECMVPDADLFSPFGIEPASSRLALIRQSEPIRLLFLRRLVASSGMGEERAERDREDQRQHDEGRRWLVRFACASRGSRRRVGRDSNRRSTVDM